MFDHSSCSKKDERSAPMRSGSPAQSCDYRGRRSTVAAVVADGAARQLKALHEKTPGVRGVRNPCSFRTVYTDAGGLRLK